MSWNDHIYSQEDEWIGSYMVGFKLKQRTDEGELVVISVYGPVVSTHRASFWEELDEAAAKFQGFPVLFGSDYNITLYAEDRSYGLGGYDLGWEAFRDFIMGAGLQEMGSIDCSHTWQNTTSTTSRLDQYLCLIELLERYPLADVQALLDHTLIIWQTHESHSQVTYFKKDCSWLCEEGFREEITSWWQSLLGQGSATERLTTWLSSI